MGGLSVVEMVGEVGRLVSPSLVEVVQEAARTFFTNSFLTINFLPSAAAAAALLGLALVCELLVLLCKCKMSLIRKLIAYKFFQDCINLKLTSKKGGYLSVICG